MISLISCSNDDNEPTINLSLLYGTWNRVGDALCPNQNNITFNEDGSYVRLHSGNSCDFNENDTYRYTGTYSVNRDNISFNQLTSSVIEEGVNDPLSIDDIPAEQISQKITVITESQLFIERLFRLGNQNFNDNWSFSR